MCQKENIGVRGSTGNLLSVHLLNINKKQKPVNMYYWNGFFLLVHFQTKIPQGVIFKNEDVKPNLGLCALCSHSSALSSLGLTVVINSGVLKRLWVRGENKFSDERQKYWALIFALFPSMRNKNECLLVYLKKHTKKAPSFQVTSNLCLLINRAKEKRILRESASHQVHLNVVELFPKGNYLHAKEAWESNS